MPEFDQYAKDYDKLLKDPIRDRFAAGSDFFFERKWILLQEFMMEVGLRPDAASWLDVGCGRGELLQKGARAFAEVCGCDVSPEMLQVAHGLNVVIQTDPTRLPFADHKFDLVTAVCVYHHVVPSDRAQLTAEIARVLKPNGCACIIEHNPLNPVTQLIVHRTPVDADARLLMAGSSRQLLAAAGLPDQRTKYFLYFPEKIYRRLSGVEGALAWLPAGGQYAVFARKQ